MKAKALMVGIALVIVGCRTGGTPTSASKDIVTTPSTQVANPGNLRKGIGWSCEDIYSDEDFAIEQSARLGLKSCAFTPAYEGQETFFVEAERYDNTTNLGYQLAKMACDAGYSVASWQEMDCKIDLDQAPAFTGLRPERESFSLTCEQIWNDYDGICAQSLDMSLVGCQFKKGNYKYVEITEGGGNTCELGARVAKEACRRGVDVTSRDVLTCFRDSPY